MVSKLVFFGAPIEVTLSAQAELVMIAPESAPKNNVRDRDISKFRDVRGNQMMCEIGKAGLIRHAEFFVNGEGLDSVMEWTALETKTVQIEKKYEGGAGAVLR